MKQPPRITFKTKIYHPNINSGGEVFLDILQREHWRSDQSIGTLLTSIVAVLYDPMLDYPVNGEAADLYKNDIERYEEVAMAWTWEHSTAIVSYSPAKEDKPWLDYCEAVAAMCSADRAEERLRRRRKAEEEEKRLAAAEECKGQIKGRSSGRGVSLLWKRALMFLQGWSVAMPFTAFRRRCFSVSLLTPAGTCMFFNPTRT